MELIQRLGSPDKEYEVYAKLYLDLIKRHKGCCDTVWLSSMYGYPKLERHKERAALLHSIADLYRESGINVSLQICNTIGHGAYMSSEDCTGLVYDYSPVEKLVGANGEVADYCFCWNGEYFRKYIMEMVSVYSEMQPDCVWIDDDLRASNHWPVAFGCFCDGCMRKFNQKHNQNFTREKLVAEILHGDIQWREKWVEFVRKGLYDFTFELCTEIHRVAPNAEIGYQYAVHGAYTGYGFDYIFKAMRDATGKAPRSRPGGGAYSDRDANVFIDKVFAMNWSNKALPKYVKNKTPEIECLPDFAFQKTPAGTAFESSLYFAYGNTDMSYSDMTAIREPISWYDELFEQFSINRKYWDKMSEYNKESYQSGLHFYMSKNIWRKTLAKNEGFSELNYENWGSVKDFARDALPISFDEDDMSVVLLHPETAKVLSDNEIALLLTKNVITDGETLSILKGKVDLGFDTAKMTDAEIAHTNEKFLPHVTRPELLNDWTYSGMTPGKEETYRLINCGVQAEILAVYMDTRNGIPYPNAINYYISEAIVKTGKGGTWAVLGYKPWKGAISSLRRDQLLNIADYISGNSLCARLQTMTPTVLMPRKNRNGKTVCVSVANVSVGKSGKSVLMIRNSQSENFRFMAQNGVETFLSYEKKGEEVYLLLPQIDAWTVGTVFCE